MARSFGVAVSRTTWYDTENFGCGVAPVRFRGELFLVDEKGKKASKNLPYDHILQFVEDLGIDQKGELQGFLNPRGEVVIPAQYQRAWPFNNGLALVTTATGSAYLDLSGKTVWESPK